MQTLLTYITFTFLHQFSIKSNSTPPCPLWLHNKYTPANLLYMYIYGTT